MQVSGTPCLWRWSSLRREEHGCEDLGSGVSQCRGKSSMGAWHTRWCDKGACIELAAFLGGHEQVALALSLPAAGEDVLVIEWDLEGRLGGLCAWCFGAEALCAGMQRLPTRTQLLQVADGILLVVCCERGHGCGRSRGHCHIGWGASRGCRCRCSCLVTCVWVAGMHSARTWFGMGCRWFGPGLFTAGWGIATVSDELACTSGARARARAWASAQQGRCGFGFGETGVLGACSLSVPHARIISPPAPNSQTTPNTIHRPSTALSQLSTPLLAACTPAPTAHSNPTSAAMDQIKKVSLLLPATPPDPLLAGCCLC